MSKPTITRRAIVFVAFFFALASTLGTAQDADLIRTFRGRTMGTTYMVKVFAAEEVSDDIRLMIDRELRRVNDQMSTYLKTSELSCFNSSPSTDWFDVSPDTALVVDFAQRLAKKTDGAFDVTVGPLVNAWGFGPGERTEQRPDDERLQQLGKFVGYEKLSVRRDPPALRKSIPQLQVDLSSIAKGHAVDRVTALLAAAGATDVFVEIGGEVRTSGDKGGQPWQVGIQTPDINQTAAMIAHATGAGQGNDESMATSGDYRNFFSGDGKRYSHTIDPRTAAPIEHNLASVSVVTTSCMEADAWATAISVLGSTAGLQLAKAEQLNVFLITRTEDGYDMSGMGTLAQYATQYATHSAAGPPAQAVPTQGNSMAAMAIITAIAFGVILCAMAVGVMFGRKAISGSCGGLANKTADDGSVSCSLCSNPADACKELREKINSTD